MCEDRDSDLDKYVLPQNTRIDLLLNGKIHLRDGETFTEEDEDELFRPFREIEAKHYENERNKVDDYAVLDDDVVQIITWIKKDNGSTEQADVTLTHNQKMFELLLTSVYSNGNYIKDAKQLLLESAVLNTEFDASLSTYLDPEKQYRSLSELAEFYLDGMKEDIRAIVTEGFSHPRLSEMAKQYFQDLSLNAQVEQKQTEQNKLQADKLGLSKSFIALAGKQLERRYGRKLSTEEIIKIINRYEAVTGGLQEKSSTSTNKDTKAFYGTLRSQRNKTIDALRMVTEEDIDPQRLHLGEMNLEEALKAEKSIVKREYDEEQFASYTTQQFIDLFSEEKGNTVFHLRKFESESGSQRKTLNAFITKSKESAHARLSGGVCVSRDNPRTDIARQNIWDMENYIQLVLQDPDTLICQGLLLMHDNTDNGKRVLSVSFNPSSTFLFTADEESCFKALLAKAEEFAGLNNFDMIVSSPDGKGIRTNRVGGIFERAFKDKVEEKRKKFAFSEQRVFSYDPLYTMLDMDVLWEKPEENAQESS